MFPSFLDLTCFTSFFPAFITPVHVSITTTIMIEVIAHVMGRKNALNDVPRYNENFASIEFIYESVSTPLKRSDIFVLLTSVDASKYTTSRPVKVIASGRFIVKLFSILVSISISSTA